MSPPCVAGLQVWQSPQWHMDSLLLSLLLPWLPSSISGAQQGCVGPVPSDITSQQFWVVFLVLSLPANSQGSADALLQDPISSSSPAMAGAGHHGREGVAVGFIVFEMSPGNAAWLAGSLFLLWDGFEEAV